jgi:hypothetical protein
MIEVKYKDSLGCDGVLMDYRDWLLDDIEALAEVIADEDMNISGPDLVDIEEWPRIYTIEVNGKWVSVSVDMKYEPVFSAFVVEGGEG